MNVNKKHGLFQELFMPTYAPFEKVFVRGKGTVLYDIEGRSYLDFCSGIAVNNLGHCHPEVVRAIREQTGKLMHISNLYIHNVELELAELVAGMTFPGRLFLCQSGAEANETAIKLARKYARAALKQDRYKFVTAMGSFHGRTLGTIAATGQEKYKVDFEPLPEGFVHVPYDDLDAVSEAIDDKTCAVMVEPVQGEGGVVIPKDGYLKGLSRLCADRGVLLILDEVQTGFGRTGTLFAFQREGIKPDIITMAKAFGGGLPLGGVMARPEVAAAFSPGNHATTFGGNPVTCSAALAVLRVMERENLPERAVTMGARLISGLGGMKNDYPELIRDVRGRGLMIGVELIGNGKKAQDLCNSKGLLITCIQEKVLRFTPPLTVSAEEVDSSLEIIREVFQEMTGK